MYRLPPAPELLAEFITAPQSISLSLFSMSNSMIRLGVAPIGSHKSIDDAINDAYASRPCISPHCSVYIPLDQDSVNVHQVSVWEHRRNLLIRGSRRLWLGPEARTIELRRIQRKAA